MGAETAPEGVACLGAGSWCCCDGCSCDGVDVGGSDGCEGGVTLGKSSDRKLGRNCSILSHVTSHSRCMFTSWGVGGASKSSLNPISVFHLNNNYCQQLSA